MPPKPKPKPKFAADYASFVSNQGKPLSPTSIAIYKAALNKIAATGYKTKDDLLNKQSDVVKVIKDEFSSDAQRRVILSAIFRVLDGEPLDKKRAYYDLFQASKAPIKSNETSDE